MTGGSFAPSAVRLAGLAGAVLGWSPDAFWGATPAELGAVLGVLGGGGEDGAPPDPGTLARLRGMWPDG